MSKLLIVVLLLGLPIFLPAEDFTTRLGTETAEFQGGVIRTAGDGHAYNAYGTRLVTGLNRWIRISASLR